MDHIPSIIMITYASFPIICIRASTIAAASTMNRNIPAQHIAIMPPQERPNERYHVIRPVFCFVAGVLCLYGAIKLFISNDKSFVMVLYAFVGFLAFLVSFWLCIRYTMDNIKEYNTRTRQTLRLPYVPRSYELDVMTTRNLPRQTRVRTERFPVFPSTNPRNEIDTVRLPSGWSSLATSSVVPTFPHPFAHRQSTPPPRVSYPYGENHRPVFNLDKPKEDTGKGREGDEVMSTDSEESGEDPFRDSQGSQEENRTKQNKKGDGTQNEGVIEPLTEERGEGSGQEIRTPFPERAKLAH